MGHGLASQPGEQVVGCQHRHGAPRGIRGTPDVRQDHCRGQGGRLLARFLPLLTSYSLLQGSSRGGGNLGPAPAAAPPGAVFRHGA